MQDNSGIKKKKKTNKNNKRYEFTSQYINYQQEIYYTVF